ncbi:MAG TPA: hypothetical protein VGL09_03585 [Methylomirabilota bacterium]
MRPSFAAALSLALALGGCASWSARHQSHALLEEADRRLERLDYLGALEAYDEILLRYPDSAGATRARARREPLVEAARLRAVIAAREAEILRLREEVGRRQADVARLAGEAEQLRADLEQLKKIDLRLERPRR